MDIITLLQNFGLAVVLVIYYVFVEKPKMDKVISQMNDKFFEYFQKINDNQKEVYIKEIDKQNDILKSISDKQDDFKEIILTNCINKDDK